MRDRSQKLIRDKEIDKLNKEDYSFIHDNLDELNRLYMLKIQECAAQIKNTEYKDPHAFAELIQATKDFALMNGGIDIDELVDAIEELDVRNGEYSNTIQINLSPNDPSNAIYFLHPNNQLG